MSSTIAVIIGVILGVMSAIAACILIMPANRAETFKNNKFLKWLHDLVNFKALLIEKIMKVLYVLSTCICICVGFFLLFGKMGYRGSTALIGLALMVLGPIVTRLVYEGLMLIILITKNVIEINNRMGDSTEDDPEIM